MGKCYTSIIILLLVCCRKMTAVMFSCLVVLLMNQRADNFRESRKQNTCEMSKREWTADGRLWLSVYQHTEREMWFQALSCLFQWCCDPLHSVWACCGEGERGGHKEVSHITSFSIQKEYHKYILQEPLEWDSRFESKTWMYSFFKTYSFRSKFCKVVAKFVP